MNSVMEKFMLLVEKISNTTKRYHTFDTDVNIYRSEIHIIHMIGDRKETHISEISRLIGVTKGTVSQIVKRLEDKGLVKKCVDKRNNTRQLVSLTDKGVTAFHAHIEYHQRLHEDMLVFLQGLSSENKVIIEEFIDRAHSMIADHL